MTGRAIQFTWSEEQAETCYAALRAFQIVINHADPGPLLEAVRKGGAGQGIPPASIRQATDELRTRMAFLVMGDATRSTRLTHLEAVLNHLAQWIREGEAS